MQQTFLTQYAEKPYFEWEGNKFEIVKRGLFRRIKTGQGLGGIARFIYKYDMHENYWFAIICEDGFILVWHYCTIPNYEYLKKNDWRDKETYNKRCPFAEYFEELERREKR